MFSLDDNAIISYGGGVNSTAMALLLVDMSWCGRIIFADTGAEWPDTYEYIDYFEHEWLQSRELHIERIGADWRIENKRRGLLEYCEWRLVIPLVHRRWCTVEYKVKPINRWCKENNVTTQYIGIAADEAYRQPGAIRPLCDLNITRAGCIKIIKEHGLNVPPRSKCICCPMQSNAEWRRLWQEHPDVFARCERLEQNVQRAKGATWSGVATLDASGKTTLAMRRDGYERQISMEGLE